MLEEISIRNLGVVKQATLPFGPGLSVISGESGAGKTALLSALNLLLGKRADASIVRYGADHASIEGCWHLKDTPHVERIEETGAMFEDDQLYINRTVKADGKSRAVLGGKTTPTKVLTAATVNLVSIHGQADQLRLKATDEQRAALDRFGKPIRAQLDSYQTTYRAWRKLAKRIKELEESQASRQRRFDELSLFVEDFHALSPEEDEQRTLTREIETLSHMDTLREGASTALQLLAPEDYETAPVEEQVRTVAKMLAKLSAHDARLDPLVAKADEALASLEDITSTLEDYSANLDDDSLETLYSAQERLQLLDAFCKKHRAKMPELMEKAADAEKQMVQLDPRTHDISALKEDLTTLETTLLARAEKLTTARKTAIKKLEGSVNKELAGLAMASSKLIVAIHEQPLALSGADEIQFMLASAGSPTLRPIAKAASGGELSRIMLALEVVLADPLETPTFVFDEVDSGVGGATAIEIGKRLALLAQEAQVIVVSHLPQVAAFGSNHLLVTKTDHAAGAEATVKKLTEAQRVKEITRMLSGLSDSTHGKNHAQELLTMVDEFRASL